MATGKKNARGRIVDPPPSVAESASHRQGGAHSISTEPAPSSLRRDRASDRFGSSSAQSIRNFWLPISTLLSVQRCIAPTVTGVCNAVVARPLSTPLMSSSTEESRAYGARASMFLWDTFRPHSGGLLIQRPVPSPVRKWRKTILVQWRTDERFKREHIMRTAPELPTTHWRRARMLHSASIDKVNSILIGEWGQAVRQGAGSVVRTVRYYFGECLAEVLASPSRALSRTFMTSACSFMALMRNWTSSFWLFEARSSNSAHSFFTASALMATPYGVYGRCNNLIVHLCGVARSRSVHR